MDYDNFRESNWVACQLRTKNCFKYSSKYGKLIGEIEILDPQYAHTIVRFFLINKGENG
jgi:hypothetical protein